MNKTIEELADKASAKSGQPAWFWRNIIRWRWQFARINKSINVEQFIGDSIP